MLFSSISFLLYFLPALVGLYYLIPQSWRQVRNLLLLVASLVFYAVGGAKFLLLMFSTIAICYLGALCTLSSVNIIKKVGPMLSIICALGLLGWFKYAGFFSEIVNTFFPTSPILSIVLPIGISFYTFQGVSYVVDVCRGDAAMQKNPLKVALYIALFPQLIAGPIVRYTTIAEEIDNRSETFSDVMAGLQRFAIGFGKKMLLANTAGVITDTIYAQPAENMSVSLAWMAAITAVLQIYFDFSGYSDMAIGLGRIFGFHFLENFNYPFISKSVTEFWRRWHISLSSWFRDYVYIPLGGSRCGTARQVFNILAVWLLTGFWHGASWNFVLWGGFLGIVMLGEKYLWGKFLQKLPVAPSILYTNCLFIISVVIFHLTTPREIIQQFQFMFGLYGNPIVCNQTFYYLVQYWPEWIAFVLCSLPIFPMLRKFVSTHITSRGGLMIANLCSYAWSGLLLVLGYMMLVSGSFNPFIYFRF